MMSLKGLPEMRKTWTFGELIWKQAMTVDGGELEERPTAASRRRKERELKIHDRDSVQRPGLVADRREFCESVPLQW